MTYEMLELAGKNRAEAGAENVEFLKGHIEEIPLPEGHVDVVISNCGINLSTDKPKVTSEAFRVLKPRGRFAVSDMVFLGDKGRLPAELVRSMEAWSGCVSGALEKDEYVDHVITVCDDASEACPYFPGARNRLHWSLEDPSRAEGSEEERLAIFRRVRDEIRERIEQELVNTYNSRIDLGESQQR